MVLLNLNGNVKIKVVIIKHIKLMVKLIIKFMVIKRIIWFMLVIKQRRGPRQILSMNLSKFRFKELIHIKLLPIIMEPIHMK